MFKVMLTNDCNLRCRYCYEKNKNKNYMSILTAKKSVDFYFEKFNRFDDISAIRFHGGEPFLNFDVLKETVEYFVDKSTQINKDYRFEVTTNGTLITKEISEFLEKYKFKVTISMDGTKVTHDLNRKYKSGEGSYEDVVKGMENIKEKFSHSGFFIRMTLTPDTIGSAYKNIIYYFKEGYSNFRICLDFYSNWNGKEETVKKQFEKLKKFYIKERENIYIDLFDGNFTNYILNADKLYFCNAGDGTVIVDSNGKIYPCVYAIDLDLDIGNVYKGIDREKFQCLIRENFSPNESKYLECKNCEINYFCMGMKCSFVNLSTTGFLNVPSEAMCLQEKSLYILMQEIFEELYLNKDKKLLDLINRIKNHNELKIRPKILEKISI